jgi:hypothetical protein
VKWEVCEKSTFLSLCLNKERSVYKIQYKVQIIRASQLFMHPLALSPDYREYTVLPTILFVSPKGPNDEKCLGPTNPLIRP